MDSLLKIALTNAVMALVLALIVWLITLRCKRPALVHGLWVLVLLKLITPPLIDLPVVSMPHEEPSEVIPQVDVSPVSVPEAVVVPVPSFEWSWRETLISVWLTGSALIVLFALRQIFQFMRMLRRASPVSGELQREAEQLAGSYDLRTPRLWFLPGRMTPMVWAIGWRAHVLLPRELFDSLSVEQQHRCLHMSWLICDVAITGFACWS